MGDGSCVFNRLMGLICLSQHHQAYYHFFSCLAFRGCSEAGEGLARQMCAEEGCVSSFFSQGLEIL